ncbi:glass-like 2 [Homarus americanus]|uniref:Glass-like 2 n=1 Tax=Homarus americanus TaxID=6706 RepID=A0A8J5K1T0_HOMAM|nr:glass-like 2 [Homarus americanus]
MFGGDQRSSGAAVWGNVVLAAQDNIHNQRVDHGLDSRDEHRASLESNLRDGQRAGWPRSWVGSNSTSKDSSGSEQQLSSKYFQCPDCDKTFATKWEYERHRRTHTGEKPFECPVCPYRATQKTSLQKHLRTHSGEKPYACHLCSYKASQKVHLQNHIRTHSNNMTFNCPLCPFRSSRSHILKEHMQIHTENK